MDFQVGKRPLCVGNKGSKTGAVAGGVRAFSVKSAKKLLCVGGRSVLANEVGDKLRGLGAGKFYGLSFVQKSEVAECFGFKNAPLFFDKRETLP